MRIRAFINVYLLLTGLSQVSVAQIKPVDPKATRATIRLYQNMQRLAQEGIMFGHQDDLAYGIGWKYREEGSDVRYTVGEYPAVFGWDLGHLELNEPENIDSVPFSRMREFMIKAYKMGAVNTISWHLHNPITGESSWSKVDGFGSILPGGEKHMEYQVWLGRLATFLKSLKVAWGKKIPVILRLYHEHNGSWFWWGREHCSPEEYRALWQMTVQYLRDQGVHNVLYAYSPDKFNSPEEYLERYPGDAYIDILGFDAYHRNAPESNEAFLKHARSMAEAVCSLAQTKKKVAAWTETGLEALPESKWWTEMVRPIVKGLDLSYVLVWRNANMQHYFAPYPNQTSSEDFQAFYEERDVFFQKTSASYKLYKKFKSR